MSAVGCSMLLQVLAEQRTAQEVPVVLEEAVVAVVAVVVEEVAGVAAAAAAGLAIHPSRKL